MNQLKLVVVLVFAFLLVLFAVLNPNPVEINFFGLKTPTAPLIVVVIGAVAMGAIIAAILGTITQMKQKKILSGKEKEIKELKDKVVKLELKIREMEEKNEEEEEEEGRKTEI